MSAEGDRERGPRRMWAFACVQRFAGCEDRMYSPSRSTKEEALEYAYGQGWKKISGRWYCYTCARKKANA